MPNDNGFTIEGVVLKKYTGKGEEKVTIPNSVTTIGENIFKRCSNLKNVKAPAKFKDTLLKELGNKVEFIDSNEKK